MAIEHWRSPAQPAPVGNASGAQPSAGSVHAEVGAG
jgi:hypothetical protein